MNRFKSVEFFRIEVASRADTALAQLNQIIGAAFSSVERFEPFDRYTTFDPGGKKYPGKKVPREKRTPRKKDPEKKNAPRKKGAEPPSSEYCSSCKIR